MESAPYARPKAFVSLKEASSTMMEESDGSCNYKSLVGGKDDVPSRVSASAKTWGLSGTRPENDGEPLYPAMQGVAHASPKSQLTKDIAQETVRAERLIVKPY